MKVQTVQLKPPKLVMDKDSKDYRDRPEIARTGNDLRLVRYLNQTRPDVNLAGSTGTMKSFAVCVVVTPALVIAG